MDEMWLKGVLVKWFANMVFMRKLLSGIPLKIYWFLKRIFQFAMKINCVLISKFNNMKGLSGAVRAIMNVLKCSLNHLSFLSRIWHNIRKFSFSGHKVLFIINIGLHAILSKDVEEGAIGGIMGRLFKWNMFFTSFLPLWCSIILSDFWSIGNHAVLYLVSLELAGMHWLCVISEFLWKIKIEAITVILLIIYIIISIHQINKIISEQERAANPERGTIKRAKRANKLTAEFLLAYILPMIAFDFSNLKSIVLFSIYFSVLSFLCVRNSNVYTNILLEFKGYRMYECDIECGVMNSKHLYTDCLIISKNNLAQTVPHEISYFDFENYIYIEIGDSANE
ncbi:hypothetical protein [Desulfitobacterium dehalogenans]|uniref:hypothetical protein n=1 Tax=Desulfitobacterium dehalogenans TaxID=36854 RepID=UPI001FA7F723|nr:hypothetical protein [Desulfitobacterium dehalogenans]